MRRTTAALTLATLLATPLGANTSIPRAPQIYTIPMDDGLEDAMEQYLVQEVQQQSLSKISREVNERASASGYEINGYGVALLHYESTPQGDEYGLVHQPIRNGRVDDGSGINVIFVALPGHGIYVDHLEAWKGKEVQSINISGESRDNVALFTTGIINLMLQNYAIDEAQTEPEAKALENKLHVTEDLIRSSQREFYDKLVLLKALPVNF